jgi:hypothetical protein
MSCLASSKTAQIWVERFAWGERSNAPVAQTYPGRRFALPWAFSFCPFGADGSIDPQEFSDHAKRGDCPRVFLKDATWFVGLLTNIIT